MKTLNFYHQKRKDGGRRTGVEWNGESVLELFQPGRIPLDSALEWFVDVRWRGKCLPTMPEEIRSWLLDETDDVREHLQSMAYELEAGIDPEWPLTRDFSTSPKGVSVKIVCSAVRRLTCREIYKVLLELKRSWPHLIASLPALHAEIAA